MQIEYSGREFIHKIIDEKIRDYVIHGIFFH